MPEQVLMAYLVRVDINGEAVGSPEHPGNLAASTPQRFMGEKTIRPSRIRSRHVDVLGRIREYNVDFGESLIA
jgi:hypothetical protein